MHPFRRRRRGGADTAPTPTITDASPSSGPPAGGTTVTLTGTGYISPGGQFRASYVTVGTSRGTSLTVASKTSLSFVTPAGSLGVTAIYLTSPAGTVTFPWTYAASPDALLTEGGDTLTTEAGDRLVLE